jgi:hypothetical protein
MSDQEGVIIDVPVEQQVTEQVDQPSDEVVFDDDGNVVSTEPEIVDDSEEIEHEGAKYKIPKALKGAVMMHSDYTRKTQEVAEQRRNVEAQEVALRQQTENQQQNLIEVAKFVAINDQLSQYDQVDYSALNQTDPVKAQQLWIERTQLQEKRQELAAQLQSREQERLFNEQRATAKRLEEGRAYVSANIKDWSPQLADKLASIGREMGYTEQELYAPDIRTLKLLHRAYLGDQVLKKPIASPKSTVEAKPVTQVSGKSSTVKSPSQMTDKEFAAWRRSQIAKRNS